MAKLTLLKELSKSFQFQYSAPVIDRRPQGLEISNVTLLIEVLATPLAGADPLAPLSEQYRIVFTKILWHDVELFAEPERFARECPRHVWLDEIMEAALEQADYHFCYVDQRSGQAHLFSNN